MSTHNIPTDIDFINLNDIATEELIPEDDYHVKLVEGDVRENKAKDGFYVNYAVVIQSGEHAGRRVWSMWPLKPKALWKMDTDFKAIGYRPADGKPHLADLLGFEGIAHIVIDPGKDGFKDKNAIKHWVGPLK